jgi:hypothetical protein
MGRSGAKRAVFLKTSPLFKNVAKSAGRLLPHRLNLTNDQALKLVLK